MGKCDFYRRQLKQNGDNYDISDLCVFSNCVSKTNCGGDISRCEAGKRKIEVIYHRPSEIMKQESDPHMEPLEKIWEKTISGEYPLRPITPEEFDEHTLSPQARQSENLKNFSKSNKNLTANLTKEVKAGPNEVKKNSQKNDICDDVLREMRVQEALGNNTEVKKIRQEVLEKAIHMVCGDREQDYGSPEQSLSLIGKFWETYVNAKCIDKDGKVHIDGADAATMMVLFKVARVATGRFKEDNFVDMCGYAANGAEIQTRNMKEAEHEQTD